MNQDGSADRGGRSGKLPVADLIAGDTGRRNTHSSVCLRVRLAGPGLVLKAKRVPLGARDLDADNIFSRLAILRQKWKMAAR